MSSFSGTTQIEFDCNNATGNGYVTFTANATAHYKSAPTGLFDSQAIAPTIYTPQQTPGGTTPNVLVDTVKPTLTWGTAVNQPAGTDGSHRPWYNAAVIEAYTTMDNLSGVFTRVPVSPATSADGANYQAIQLASEGTGIRGQVTVTDKALNIAQPGTADSPNSPPFNIDLTKPTIVPSTNPASANGAGWFKTPVTVHFTCNDPAPAALQGNLAALGGQAVASGVNFCTPNVTLSLDGAGQAVPGSVNDYATNANSTSATGINIDQTAPTISGSPDRAPNAYGWYNADVTVSFICVDPVPTNPAPYPATATPSGIGFCTAPVLLNSDGDNQSVPGTATDNAGNGAGASVSGLKIDKTPPTIATPTATTADTQQYTAGTWTNQDVTVTFSCSDNLSGPLVAGNITNPIITGLPASGATVAYQNPDTLHSTALVTLTAETTAAGVTLTANCQDTAGNNATSKMFGPVLIDKTPPTVTGFANIGSSNGPAYTAGQFTNQSVVVGFNCSDPLSGPAAGTTTGATTETAQGMYTVQGSCQDVAGNTGNGSFGPVNIDTTTPGVVISSPQATTYLLNQQITPSYQCGDNSGGDTATCTGNPSDSPYPATAVGPATYSVHAMDVAGNGTNPDPSVNYLVIYKFTGFQAPLQNAVMKPYPSGNFAPNDSGSFTIGSTIPVQWQLQDAANAYTATLAAVTSIVAYPNGTCSGPDSGSGTTLYDASTNTAALSYDTPNNRFVFNWNTTGMTAGCYNLVVTTNDTAQWSTIVHLATDTFVGFDAPLGTASAPATPVQLRQLRYRIDRSRSCGSW